MERREEARKQEGEGTQGDSHPLVYSMARTSRDLFFFDLGCLHECISQVMRGAAEVADFTPQLEDESVWAATAKEGAGKRYVLLLEQEVQEFCAELDLEYLKTRSDGRARYLLGRNLAGVRKAYGEGGEGEILNESSRKKDYWDWEAPQDFDKRIGSSRFPPSAKKES